MPQSSNPKKNWGLIFLWFFDITPWDFWICLNHYENNSHINKICTTGNKSLSSFSIYSRYFFALILKRCREVHGRTSVGANLWRTSVSRNLKSIFQIDSKSGILYIRIEMFCRFFRKTSGGPRMDVGGGKFKKDLGRLKFRKISPNWLEIKHIVH